jgi:hypothetical protein
LIGAHFFTFIKNYFSFRSGTSVYRNKPFGKVVVLLRSSIYFFTLFYMSFNRHYRYLKSQTKIRRKISYRAAYNEYLIMNRNSVIRRKRTRGSDLLLIPELSSTHHCYSVYFKQRTGWLHSTQCYNITMVRSVSRAVSMSWSQSFLRSTYVVAAPMCATLFDTSLSHFVSSYARVVSPVAHVTSRIQIGSVLWRTYIVSSRACLLYSAASFSFVSFLGSLYHGVPTENVFFRMHTFIKSLYISGEIVRYVHSYYLICDSFSTYNYACHCYNLFSKSRQGFQLLCSIRSVVSFYFYNIINSFVAEHSISYGVLENSVQSLKWTTVPHYLLVLNGFLFIRAFDSAHYQDLCLLLQSGFFAYNNFNCLDSCSFFFLNFMLPRRVMFKRVLTYSSVLRSRMYYGESVTRTLLSDVRRRRFRFKSRSLKIRMAVQQIDIAQFIRSQLVKHRCSMYSSAVFLHRTYVFLHDSIRTSMYANSNVMCYESTLIMCAYNNSLTSSILVAWPFGYSAVKRVVTLFTSVTSMCYTVFLKCRMLSLLYSLLYSYSFFIEQGTKLLSHVYFIHFFLAVFLRRWWSDCFFSSIDMLSLSVQNSTKSDFLDSRSELFSFNYSMSFHIFMFIDQSTFPFNGCKGRKRN